MWLQIAAQKRALNIALKATSAPGFNELSLAIATFSQLLHKQKRKSKNTFFENHSLFIVKKHD